MLIRNQPTLIGGGALLAVLCWFVADRAGESRRLREHAEREAAIGVMSRKLDRLMTEKEPVSGIASPGSVSTQNSREIPGDGESIRLPATILRTQVPGMFAVDRRMKPSFAQMLQMDSREVGVFEAAMAQFETDLKAHQARTTHVNIDTPELLELTVASYAPALSEASERFRQAINSGLDSTSADLVRSIAATSLAQAVDMLAQPDTSAVLRITRAQVPKYPQAIYDIDMSWSRETPDGPVKSGRTANCTPAQLQKLLGQTLQTTSWGPSVTAEALQHAIVAHPTREFRPRPQASERSSAP